MRLDDYDNLLLFEDSLADILRSIYDEYENSKKQDEDEPTNDSDENDENDEDVNAPVKIEPIDDEDENEDENNYEGLVRNVKGAYLVYKRENIDGTYDEMWVYNIDDVKKATLIRREILAGTDIDPKTLRSPDGEQTAKIDTVGNAQFLIISGLPQ